MFRSRSTLRLGASLALTAALAACSSLPSSPATTADGKLTGGLVGTIVNAQGKRKALEATCAKLGCAPAQAIAIGDGANDLEMMGAAGASVAYRAKPVVRERTTFAINHNGLDALLGWLPPRE